MDTNTSDEKLFHKLINIQRNGKTSKLSQLTVDGKILVKPGDIAEGWDIDILHLLNIVVRGDSESTKSADLQR
jgi:hypothetical protein